MGVFQRDDSPFWWLWLETAPKGAQREKTSIVIGRTVSRRRDSQAQAETLYHRRMSEIATKVHRLPQPLDAIRFDPYADAYETTTIAARKGASRERELLVPLRAFFGRDFLARIDPDRVRAYVTKRRQDRRVTSVHTINREVDLLKGMLRDAVPRYLDRSPIVGLRRERGPKARKRLLQPEEETRLLAAATDPVDHALIVLALDTLSRLGDCLDLQRTDRDGDWITLTDPKNGEPLDVPLSPRAAAALDAIPTSGTPYYFAKFRKAKNPRDWHGAVRQRLERLCAAADVPFGKKEQGVTFHGATRKTGATRYLVEKGVDVATVQRLGGWKDPRVLLGIYTESQRADLLAAVGQPRPALRRKA